MRDSFKNLLEEFGNSVGIAEISELGNPLTLKIDQLTLTIEEQSHEDIANTLVYCSLGTVDEDKQLAAYQTFLEANLLWSGTGDATIGVNSETREVIIAFMTASALINGEALAHIVRQMVLVGEIWRRYIESLNNDSALPLQHPDESMSQMLKI